VSGLFFFVRDVVSFRLLGPRETRWWHVDDTCDLAYVEVIGRAGISHSCFLFALEVCVPNPFPLDPLYHIPSLSLFRSDSEEGDREVAADAADADSGGTASTVRWVLHIISCFFAIPVDLLRAHYSIHAC
jgi:hypothetical protein